MWFVSANHPMALRCRRVGAVHHIIHVCLGLDRTVIHFRFAPKATVVRTLQIRRFVPIADTEPSTFRSMLSSAEFWNELEPLFA